MYALIINKSLVSVSELSFQGYIIEIYYNIKIYSYIKNPICNINNTVVSLKVEKITKIQKREEIK